MTSLIPTRRLTDGYEIPLLGLGVWQVPNGPDCVNAVRWALEAGYRHLDTAQAYRNEESVGEGLRRSGIPRDEVFITTKFYPGHRDPVGEAEQSLRRLGIDQVDLYIIHWPQGGPRWAWPGMERARELGYARSIGVSNFSAGELDEVMAVATVPPAVNQVQFSPFEFRGGLLSECQRREVVLEAYSSLGTGEYLRDGAVTAIADRGRPHARSGADPLVRGAGDPGDPEVNAPRADRGERPDIRFHALGRGDGRARRPRSLGRNRRGSGEQVVVSGAGARCGRAR